MPDNKSNEIICFHLPSEHHGCFSNWYESYFTYAGVRYNCAEQYMMSQKVSLGRRYDLRNKIMESHDPDKIKSLGSKDSFPEFAEIKHIWDKHCRHIVKRGVRAKFQQNPDMLQELLDTGSALLCECAGQDKIWGIGINLRNSEWEDVHNWKGSNYLGVILMEIREEFRRELAEKGFVQYIDFSNAEAIPEWKMTARYLKRIPQYYPAIHMYAYQLADQHAKEEFYDWSFDGIEDAMHTNMGGGLPIVGFYEMKQEIFEITRRLCHKSYVSDIFADRPKQWGLRGDPFFWEDLKTVFAFDELSITPGTLADRICDVYQRVTGERLTTDSKGYVQKYDHGGMSSGQLDGKWILNTCIPMLQERLENINNRY